MELPKLELDFGMKVTLGVAAAYTSAALLISPNQKEKDYAAQELYDKTWNTLTPLEAKVATFKAGRRRWTSFVEGKWYPMTRKLPGANNPIVNPYAPKVKPPARTDDY